MLFFESPVADASRRRSSILLTSGNSCTGLHALEASLIRQPSEVRWSPPTDRRYSAKFVDGLTQPLPPFCSSRFLSSSPPLTRNKSHGNANPDYAKSSLALHKQRTSNDKVGKSSRHLYKDMNLHLNNNDNNERPSNSLQLYKTDHERGQLTAVGSPHEVRREFGVCHQSAGATNVPMMAPMPSHIPPGYAVGAPPPGTKMLVDPTTGQQYFVPTAQPQVAYYPVYYPQSQPIFYQPAPAGYFVPSHQHPQVPSSPTHHHPHGNAGQPMFFPTVPQSQPQSQPQSNYVSAAAPNNTYAHSQAYGSPPYHVEIPPSNASVASSHFQRNHESRVSMESGASSASGSSRNKQSDDSVSPALRHVGRPTAATTSGDGQTPTSARGATKLFPDNWLHNSARYSSAASSSSGFYSGDLTLEKSHLSTRLNGTGESQDSPTHRPSAGDQQAKLTPRSQPQPWWQGGDSPTTKAVQSPRREPPFEEKNLLHSSPCRCDPSALDRRHSASPALQSVDEQPVPPPPRPTQKAIRMDFDLNDPSIAADQPATPVVAEKAKVIFTPATAFTISFDDNALSAAGDENDTGRPSTGDVTAESRSPKKAPLSLQDAARQAPTGRRLLRRIAVPPKQSVDSATAANQDPKEYLFSKMFEHGGSTQNHGGSVGMSPFGGIREMDTASEAGTYIVEKECKMVTSQVLDTDEDESSSVLSLSTSSSSSSTTISDNGVATAQPGPQLLQRPTAVRPDNPAASSLLLHPRPSANATAMTPKSPLSVRRSLMSDLRRLRDEKNDSTGDQSPTSPRRPPLSTAGGFLPSVATAGSGPAKTKPVGGPPTRLCESRFAVGGGSGTATNSTTFRPSARCHSETRTDGGRFSMRTTGGTPSNVYRPGANASARPRPAVVRPTPTNRPAQDTPEMVAWLRRKEYDPRKAAAEARKMQQLKQSLMKLASGCDKVLEAELGQHRPTARVTAAAVSPSKKWLEETYLANRSISYHNAGGFLSSANSAFQQWQKAPSCNKSYDNLSCLGEENGNGGLDEFAQLTIAQTSSNLKRTVDALTEKCNKSIELIKLCNKSALSPSVENLLQSVVESSAQPIDEPAEDGYGEENGAKISDRLERLNSAFDAIQKYLEEQSSTSATKLQDFLPSAAIASSSSMTAGVDNRPAGSSTQRFLLGISDLANARRMAGSPTAGSPIGINIKNEKP